MLNSRANEELIEQVLAVASNYIHLPLVIAGDYNVEANESATIQAALATADWHLAGTEGVPTYEAAEKSSEIDFALCNRHAYRFLANTAATDVKVGTHVQVTLSLDLPVESFWHRRPPKGRDLSRPQRISEYDHDGSTWDQCCAAKNIDDIWKQWQTQALHCLLEPHPHSAHKVQHYLRQRQGECEVPWEKVKFKADSPPTAGISRILKAKRRVAHFRVMVSHPDTLLDVHTEALAHKILLDLQWAAQRHAKCLVDQRKILIGHFLMVPLQQMLDDAHGETLHDFWEQIYLTELRRLKLHRLNAWRFRMRQVWHTVPGRLFQWAAEKPDRRLVRVISDTGTHLCPAAMETVVREAWCEAVYHKPSTAEQVQAFLREYESEIDEALPPWIPLPCIHGTLAKILHSNIKPNSSAGLDGWSWKELRTLPPVLIDMLEQFFVIVEQQQKWPISLLRCKVVMLAKNSSGSPLATRPISVLSCITRLWTKLRYEQLQAWQLSWTPPNIIGGVPGRRAEDISYAVAASMETAAATKQAQSALLIDKSLCFDSLAPQLLAALLTRLQVPDSLVGTYLDQIVRCQRVMCINGHLGQPFMAQRGLPQGCIFSVLGIKLIMTIFSIRLAKLEGVCSFFYFDDVSHVAAQPKDLARALQAHELFDKLAQLTTNVKKTQLVSNGWMNMRLKRHGQLAYLGHVIEAVSMGILLGVEIATREIADTPWRAKCVQAQRQMRRIALLPIPADVRVQVAAQLSGAALAFSAWLHWPGRTDLSKWRKSAAKLLWKRTQSWASQAVMWTLLAPGHRLDLMGITLYRTLDQARRSLQARQIWDMYLEWRLHGHTATGPFQQLHRAAAELGWQLDEHGSLNSLEDGTFCLSLTDPEMDVKHWQDCIRDAIRQRLFRIAKPRQDLSGVARGVDVKATTMMLRSAKDVTSVAWEDLTMATAVEAQLDQSDDDYDDDEDEEEEEAGQEPQAQQPKQQPHAKLHLQFDGYIDPCPPLLQELTNWHRAALRLLLAGAIHVGRWWAAVHSLPLVHCPFCDQQVLEDLYHMLWVCKAWSKYRRITPWAEQFGQVDASHWPTCLAQVGILPLSRDNGHDLPAQFRAAGTRAKHVKLLHHHYLTLVWHRAKREKDMRYPYHRLHSQHHGVDLAPEVPLPVLPKFRLRQKTPVGHITPRGTTSAAAAAPEPAPQEEAFSQHLAHTYRRYPRPELQTDVTWITCECRFFPNKTKRPRPWSDAWIRAFAEYVTTLRWTDDPVYGSITWYELALDFIIKTQSFCAKIMDEDIKTVSFLKIAQQMYLTWLHLERGDEHNSTEMTRLLPRTTTSWSLYALNFPRATGVARRPYLQTQTHVWIRQLAEHVQPHPALGWDYALPWPEELFPRPLTSL